MNTKLNGADTAESPAVARVTAQLRRAVPLILLAAIVCGALSAVVTRLQPTSYASSVTFVVQSNASANDTEMLVRTISALIPTDLTGDGLRTRAKVDRSGHGIGKDLEVTRPPGSSTITVTYTDEDRAVSKAVAEQLVAELNERTQELSEPGPGQLAATFSVLPWGQGAVTTEAVAPPVLRNTLAGLLAGLLLGVILAILRAVWRPVVMDGDDRPGSGTGRFDVVLPHALAGNADTLTGVARVINRKARSSLSPTVIVTGPVDDDTRQRFADSIAAAMSRGEQRATVLSFNEFSRDPSVVLDNSETSVVVGPRVPGQRPLAELAARADAVVLLAKSGRTTMDDLVVSQTLLPTSNVTSVLLDGSRLRLGEV